MADKILQAHPRKCPHEFSRGRWGARFRTSKRLRFMACSWHMQLRRYERIGGETFMEISPRFFHRETTYRLVRFHRL